MAHKISRDLIKKFALDVGYDPNAVASIAIRPDTVTFEIYLEPKRIAPVILAPGESVHDGAVTVMRVHLIK